MLKKLLSSILCVAMAISCIPNGVMAEDEDMPSPRIHYTFDSESKTLEDRSSNGMDGKVFGTVETSDNAVLGKSLLLKGGFATLPENAVEGLSDLSVSIWVNPLRATNWSRIWDIGTSTNSYITLMAPEGERQHLACELYINGAKQRVTADRFTTNSWYNVTVTYSGTTGEMKIYQDGVLIPQEQTYNTGSPKVSFLGKTKNAYIGRSQFGADADFYGYVDDFRLYDQVLTEQQVERIVSEGTASLLDNAAASLDLAAKNGLTRLDGVQQNLALISNDDIKSYGASISWSSSKPEVISNSGELKSNVAGEKVTLTATISRGSVKKTRAFEITTSKAPITIDDIPSVTTIPGKTPILPEKITANSGAVSLGVTWEPIDPDKYAFAGSFEVSGTASNSSRVSVTVVVDSKLMKNPLIVQASGGSPDPYIYYKDGYYYYIRQDYNNGITISKARRLQDIEAAPRIVVYRAPSSGMYSKEYWAPELFYLEGNWYIYVAADNGNNANHRMYVLRSTDPANAQAPYEMVGKLAPTKYNDTTGQWEVDSAQDKWAIDGTVLEDVNGKNYFIWSGWAGNVDGQQNLYIAEMLNPYTLKGSRVLLSTPSQSWERRQLGGDVLVQEGPQIVKHGNKIHIVYSTNHSGRDVYCLGLLSMDKDSDPMNPASWTKSDGPVFTQSLDPSEQSYGPGHAMITPSPDGTKQYLIYHAIQYAGSGWGDRSARVLEVKWENDYPVFGNPVGPNVFQDEPPGTPDQVITGKYEAENAVLEGGAAPRKRNRPSGGYVVENIGSSASVTFNVTVPKEGKYLVSLMGTSLTTSGVCSQNVDINGTVYKVTHSGTTNDPSIWRPSCDANKSNGDGLYAYLKQGKNVIKVTKSADSSGNADLDYLHLQYIDEVESVTITGTNTLYEGDTTVLEASVTPYYAYDSSISWSSDNEQVALVSASGKVTALKEGKAVITAQSVSNPDIKDTFEITVVKKEEPKPPVITVKSVKITSKQGKKLTVGKTLKLKAAVSPSNAANKTVVWKSSNKNLATVSKDGKVSAKKVGKVKITATAGGVSSSIYIEILPGAPSKLKAKVTKTGRVNISFKKGAGSTKTEIVIKKGKKVVYKGKISNKTFSKKFKKGKYTVTVRGYAKYSGKTYLSLTSTTKKFTIT